MSEQVETSPSSRSKTSVLMRTTPPLLPQGQTFSTTSPKNVIDIISNAIIILKCHNHFKMP
jgi:hypothetical protein